mgnify:CR=1 FL=1
MPHTSKHIRYQVAGTKKEYTGRVLKVGNEFYTTGGGAYEGGMNGSKRLEVMNGKSSQVINKDVVTQFVVGASPGEEFYHPQYSRKKYFYSNGNEIPNGTQLHHHTMPAPGDNNFMTQHTMEGSVNVLTSRPRGMRQSRTRVSTNTTQRSQNRRQTGTSQTSDGGNMSGRRTGGSNY